MYTHYKCDIEKCGKGGLMRKAIFGIIFATFLGAGVSYAGNEELGKAGMIPLGERVATYLQSLFNATSELARVKISEARKKTIFQEPVEPFRGVIIFDKDKNTIGVMMVGTIESVEGVKPRLELAKKIVLGFNKQISQAFGITLSEKDIELAYLNGNTNQTILKYVDRNFVVPDTTVAP